MASVRITTTSDQTLQALGSGGQTAAQSWSALQGLLTARLGPEYAALLAEPAYNPARGETDWYAETTANVRPLLSLPPDEQAAIRARLDELVGGVRTLTAELAGTRDPSQRFLSTMLALAVELPNEAYLYAAGEQPILVAWGHALAGAAAERVSLRGTRAAPAAAAAAAPMRILPPPVVAAPQPPAYWAPFGVGLAAAAALLGLALFLLWRDPFQWYAAAPESCALAPGQTDLRDALDAASRREGELRRQLAQLVSTAGDQRLQCRPTPAPVRPPSRDVQRAADAGGHGGKLRVVLAWDDRNDLDLHVFCPDGHLYWRQRSACGGTLDVDANGDARVANASPVENAYFPDPPAGQYRIVVDPFAMRVSRSTDYRVTIQQEGKPDQVFTGTATLGTPAQDVTTVTVGGSP